MVSNVSEILLKNNLNYPANLPVNELNMYWYGLTGISPADNHSIILATKPFDPFSYNKICQRLKQLNLSFASPLPSLIPG